MGVIMINIAHVYPFTQNAFYPAYDYRFIHGFGNDVQRINACRGK
jgi:hypothetical protein